MIRVVVGILKRDDRILVQERPKDKPYGGYWEFPGGKIEPHESAREAICRELHEELGIEIAKADFWCDHRHAYPDKIVVLEMWLVSQFTGEPHSKEAQQLRWVTYSEMMSLRLLEGNIPLTEKIRDRFFNPRC